MGYIEKVECGRGFWGTIRRKTLCVLCIFVIGATTACASSTENVRIPRATEYGGQEVSCAETYHLSSPSEDDSVCWWVDGVSSVEDLRDEVIADALAQNPGTHVEYVRCLVPDYRDSETLQMCFAMIVFDSGEGGGLGYMSATVNPGMRNGSGVFVPLEAPFYVEIRLSRIWAEQPGSA